MTVGQRQTLAIRPFLPHQSLSLLMVAIWAVGMVAVPIIRWTIGDAALPWAIAWNVLLLAMTALTVLSQRWPRPATLRAVVVVLVGAWLVEFMGRSTGFPFGPYDYTDALQPQMGGVPLLIPFAWLMMLPAAWTMAALLAPSSRLGYTLLSAAAFTAWDLFLDPQMVAWGVWTWHQPGGYFGIPWQNFAGWYLSAALLTWLAQPPMRPAFPLLLVYSLTWLLQTIGLGIFWGLPGPAVVGALTMGWFVWAAWRRALGAAPWLG